MDEEDFFIDHHGSRFIVEAMLQASGIRIKCSENCKCSPDLSPIRKRSVSPEGRKREVEVLPYERFNGKKNIVEIEKYVEQNAKELIKAEEQAKIKAEKKKAKRDRQKQKKKKLFENESPVNNCSNSDNTIKKICSDMENLTINPDNKDTEGLDVGAAFVSKAVKKMNSQIITDESKTNREVKDINSLIKIALEYEKKEHYKEAVQYYSEALNLAPKRFDLILKRSFIYYELAKFEKSVRDAQKVLEYSPKNADGYYRLGEAYFALNNLPEAEAAFNKLLNLNAYCDEANNRIFSIRIKQLEDMGYHPNEAFTALLKSKNKTLDEAIDYLTALKTGKESADDLYYSDEDESEEEDEDSEVACGSVSTASSAATVKSSIVIDNKSELLTDPANPLGCCSLFVGNLKAKITKKEISDVFIKFGDIKDINLTTEPSCYAFVNYVKSDSAGRAMEALQGSRWLLSTTPLVVKYPTKVISNSIPFLKHSEILNKLKPAPPAKQVIGRPVPVRMRPPPLTEECFYWRTTGCSYGDRCFNLHIPENRGIALNGKTSFRKQIS